MTKILELWFINKTNSFASYRKCEDELFKILSKACETKKIIFHKTIEKLKPLGNNTLTKQRTSFTKLLNAVKNKQPSSEDGQFLERILNSFLR